MSLFLTANEYTGLAAWLGAAAGMPAPGTSVPVIANACLAVEDGGAILAQALEAVENAALVPEMMDVTVDELSLLDSAPLIVLAGGDPFSLLADLKASGADARLAAAAARGAAIAGQSAGAMVCGPSLVPVRLTSPFQAGADQALAGLGFTHRLVLPHHDRPGRAAKHRLAARRHGDRFSLCPLWDDEVLLVDAGATEGSAGDAPWRIARGGLITRPARPDDAAAVATVYHAAAQTAWAPFLGQARLAANPPQPATWRQRIEQAPGRFLVTDDPTGVVAFVLYGTHPDDASVSS